MTLWVCHPIKNFFHSYLPKFAEDLNTANLFSGIGPARQREFSALVDPARRDSQPEAARPGEIFWLKSDLTVTRPDAIFHVN